MKRRTFLTVAGASVLAACTRQRDSNTLRVAYAPTSFAPLYSALAAAFTRRHPDWRINFLPARGYLDVMQRNFRLALVDDMPDVSHDGFNLLRFYIERNLPMPLDSLAGSEAARSKFLPDAGLAGDHRFAAPFAISAPIFYYNRDLVRKAGWDSFPESWREIIELANALRVMPGVQSIYFDYLAENALAWQTLLLSQGGRMAKPDESSVAFQSAEGLRSAYILRALGRAGQIDMSRESARLAFLAGALAIYQNTTSHLQTFLSQRPRFELGVASLPRAQTGSFPASGNAAILLTRDPHRQIGAWAWIRFVVSDQGQAVLARHSGYLAQTNLDEGYGLDANLRRVAHAQLPYLTPFYSFPGSASGRISDVIEDGMRMLIAQKESPEAALSAMADGANALLRRG